MKVKKVEVDILPIEKTFGFFLQLNCLKRDKNRNLVAEDVME